MSTTPNVVLIVADHWPGSLLGIAGHPSIQTPTLDEISRNGVRFTNHYAENPVCLGARRSIMTGTTPRTHGDRTFNPKLPMPEGIPTLAQTFRDAGYQAYAVGKIHVYPQRDRIGFDDVLLDDEGRPMFGIHDDYEIYLGEAGYPGRHYYHGMSNNEYAYRPWHLPEETHVTNWATREITRQIKRRDARKPGFWYVGYRHPHPPLVPLQTYLDLYRDIPIDEPWIADWAANHDEQVYTLKARMIRMFKHNALQVAAARRAFYALCTHIDHQIRIIVGTLREESILDDTVVMFTSDHGDMLGNHNMWAKRVFYENSACVPMIVMGTAGDRRVGHHRISDRLTAHQDVMPTLLDLCGIDIPDTVDGLSMFDEATHAFIYGEDGEDGHASRMVHDGRYKLIYYPVGHRRQLFDVADDPREMRDLAGDAGHRARLEELTGVLAGEMHGSDEQWIADGKLNGEEDRPFRAGANRTLYAQRGNQWPLPPLSDKAALEWYPEDAPGSGTAMD